VSFLCKPRISSGVFPTRRSRIYSDCSNPYQEKCLLRPFRIGPRRFQSGVTVSEHASDAVCDWLPGRFHRRITAESSKRDDVHTFAINKKNHADKPRYYGTRSSHVSIKITIYMPSFVLLLQ
jgi:hypothetical protein